MSLLSRIANVFRSDRINSEIVEEMESHIAEAVEQGRDPIEARRALGLEHQLRRLRQQSHDMRVMPWLDSLRADVVFGWRQLMKRKVVSVAAVLSLALAMGACMSAFRLVDALLFRPLPIKSPERLYALFRTGLGFSDGKVGLQNTYEYPVYEQMKTAVGKQADVIADSITRPTDITYRTDNEIEKAQVQYVSGNLFGAFGLQPTVGRLLTPADDMAPGAHPYAVISYDYWAQRFGRDPNILGRTFHMGNSAFELGTGIYQIIGVGPKEFTGTEPGTITDIFLPATMYIGATQPTWSWTRMLVMLKPGVSLAPVRDQMNAVFQTNQREVVKQFSSRPKLFIERFLSWHTMLEPAPSGLSLMQDDYRLPLKVLSVLVLLVLIIACTNVANLMTAQAASRAQEMALRVSIGAGRARLLQMVMVQSGLLGLLSSALGMVFAWWAAPFVVSMLNPPSNPVRLVLPADMRVLGFGMLLALGVVLLFGLLPALRAAAVKPVSALKGGEERVVRRRMLHGLIAMQVAFCILVLFVAGLFVRTFQQLSEEPLGFTPERLLILDTVAQHPQPAVMWDQMVDHLKSVPGVQTASMSLWPLLSGQMAGNYIAVNGVPNPQLASMLQISPGWFDVMRIPLIDGHDFRASDTFPGTAIVNHTFAKEYFGNEDVLGKTFQTTQGGHAQFQIVGIVADTRYQAMREPATPVVYFPMHATATAGPSSTAVAIQPIQRASFIVRTSSDTPIALAQALRHAVSDTQPELRVSNVTTQQQLIDAQTIRERLLATLAAFFAGVALLLAAIGLYGVLNYSVLQREHELGIRIAMGATGFNIVRVVTTRVFMMVVFGAAAGIGVGMLSLRYVHSLLYGIKPNDPGSLMLPIAVLLFSSLLAAMPAVLRALRIDPAIMLRAE